MGLYDYMIQTIEKWYVLNYMYSVRVLYINTTWWKTPGARFRDRNQKHVWALVIG